MNNRENHIKSNTLTMSKAVKKFIFGKEFDLFEDENEKWDGGKKRALNMFYKINYYLFAFLLLIFLFFIGFNSDFTGLMIFLILITGIKPLNHYFALKNKVARINILNYKKIKNT
jgi:hypothetical protein